MAGFRSPAGRHLFVMVASVLVLDAAAIAVYHFAGLRTATTGVRTGFTLAWTVATALVVGLGLRRIRKARRR